MDRLLAIAGGQPLRSNDWDFIQDATADSVKALVIGLKGATGPCIIHGLEMSVIDEVISVTEGVLFDGEELCFVAAASFTYQGALLNSESEGYRLFLTPAVTTSESRTFKDSSTHNVWEYRKYLVGYDVTVPSGSIAYTPLQNILTIISDYVLTQVPAAPVQLLKFSTITLSASLLGSPQTLIPAQGANTIIKIIGISAKISPTVTLNVGTQDLNVIYVGAESLFKIGSFPNSFIEAASSKVHDMIADPTEMLVNNDVSVYLNGSAAPSSGSATIKFYCYYVVIPV